MVQVENLEAVQGGQSEEIEYLGHLLWMSISNGVKIEIEDLKRELTELGLEQFMPKKINIRDAFRRATRDVEIKREAYGQGTYVNLLVRPVKTDGNEMVRQLVREVVDGENVRLAYEPVVQFEIKKDGSYSIIPLVSELSTREREAMDGVGPLYEEATRTYEGDHIRRLIERILGACSPVSVRPAGGIYFVPERYRDTLTSLKGLVKKLTLYDKGSGNTRAWSIPVIDAQEHREMVEESLEAQVMSGSLKMIDDMKKTLELESGQGIQLSTVKQYAYQLKKMRELVEEYEDVMEYQATKVRENLEIAQKLAAKLMEKSE